MIRILRITELLVSTYLLSVPIPVVLLLPTLLLPSSDRSVDPELPDPTYLLSALKADIPTGTRIATIKLHINFVCSPEFFLV